MNLKEELNRLDRESIDNNTKYYDLKNLFEAIILTDEEKKELAKLIKDKEDPEVIYNNLAKKYGHDLSDLEIEEDYVHKTDEHTFNPLATAATLEVGDKVYDSTGEKVLEIVDKQMPNDWSVMLTIKDVATGDTWVQHSGNLALFELVVEGDHAEEVPEDIDIEFHPVDELTEGITSDGVKLPTNSRQVDSYVWRKIRPHDELTDDSSKFWVFDRSVTYGADAVLVNKVGDIPDNATYNFSLLDIDLYLNRDDDTWYVLDNSISDEELTESRSPNEGAGADYSDIISTEYAIILNGDIIDVSDNEEEAIAYAEDIEADAVRILYTIEKFDDEVEQKFGDIIWRDGEYTESLDEALVDEDKWTKEVLDILKTVLDKADDIRYEMKYATRGSRIKVNDINGLVSWLNDFNEDIEKASKELEERNDELTNGPQEENGQEENNNENQ